MLEIGDKVLCVDNNGLLEDLEQNIIFTIVDIYPYHDTKMVNLIANGTRYPGFYEHRFKTLKEIRKEKIQNIYEK